MIVTDHGFKPFTKQELQTMREPELNAIAALLVGFRWVMEEGREDGGAFLMRSKSLFFRDATPSGYPKGDEITYDKAPNYTRDWEKAFDLVAELRLALGWDMERYEFAEYLPSRGHGDTDLFALTPRLLVEAFVWTITNRRV
jgi:hypothetical protein